MELFLGASDRLGLSFEGDVLLQEWGMMGRHGRGN